MNTAELQMWVLFSDNSVFKGLNIVFPCVPIIVCTKCPRLLDCSLGSFVVSRKADSEKESLYRKSYINPVCLYYSLNCFQRVQMRVGIEDISEIIFLISQLKHKL